MVGSDQCVKENVGPEAEHPERVGVDGPPQDSRDLVIGDAERQHGEPHAHRGVHEVALDHHIPEAALVQRDVAGGEDDREKAERAQDVPVRDVELRDAARPDGQVRVHPVENEARREQQRHRPDPLAILLGPPRHAGTQGEEPCDYRGVPQDEREPRERGAPQRGTRGARDHVQGQTDERHRAPTPEHGVGVDRPDAPEREPPYCERVGPVELQGGEESGRGTHQQPHGGAHQILEGDADGRAIAGRGSTEGRVLTSPLEHGDSSRS